MSTNAIQELKGAVHRLYDASLAKMPDLDAMTSMVDLIEAYLKEAKPDIPKDQYREILEQLEESALFIERSYSNPDETYLDMLLFSDAAKQAILTLFDLVNNLK